MTLTEKTKQTNRGIQSMSNGFWALPKIFIKAHVIRKLISDNKPLGANLLNPFSNQEHVLQITKIWYTFNFNLI